MLTRRSFLCFTPAALSVAVPPDPESPAPPRSPGERRRKRGPHAVYVGEFSDGDFYPESVSDLPIVFDGPVNAIDLPRSLKSATRRAHAFNREQLAGGRPVRKWAFVAAAASREVLS